MIIKNNKRSKERVKAREGKDAEREVMAGGCGEVSRSLAPVLVPADHHRHYNY